MLVLENKDPVADAHPDIRIYKHGQTVSKLVF